MGRSCITRLRRAFSPVALLFALACLANQAHATVGAVTPFTSIEGESGTLGGGATVVSMGAPPVTQYSSAAIEASGRAYAALTGLGQYVEWTNTTGGNISAINLRSCIPDAPAGGGITNSIDLYVDGVFRQSFGVNSYQNYCYETSTNYNQQDNKNPATGNARGFWNDTHALVVNPPIAPGSTFRFQVDAGNTASFYYIDVVDVEDPPAPLGKPSGALSITDPPYNAVPNNASVDNTTVINNCFNAARSTGTKTVYIPQGTFCISAIHGGLNANGITIVGAGPWYSTLYRVTPANNTQGIANILTTYSCTVSNLSLDCNAASRAANNNNGAINCSGTNWVVDMIWMQHTTSSFWCAGEGGVARNSRTLSTWADGGNFNNTESNNGIGSGLTYSNNFVRGTGDDAMAINSVHVNIFGNTTNFYTIMRNITYANNTAICPWGGKCMGLYGGSNDIVINNLCIDTPRYMGLGVMRFGVNGSDLISCIVSNNVLIRCGGNGYNQQQQGMMIGNGGDAQGVGTVKNAYIVSNTIVDALYDGIGFSTSTNIILEGNLVDSPGLDGIAPGAPDLGTGVSGYAVLNNNTVTGVPGGHSAYVNAAGNYIVGGIQNTGFTVPGPLLAPWQDADIGTPAVTGGATYSKGVFTVVGSGADINNDHDSFHYVYQPAFGDCTVSARVETQEILVGGAKAGVMIRNSLDPSDTEASVVVTPANGITFQWRETYGGGTFSATLPGIAAPEWVRLSRAGNVFTAAYSPNGVNWTNLSSPATFSMGTNTYLGMAVTSRQDGSLCSSMLDNVTIATGLYYSGVHWEGDLLVNLQSTDLNPSVTTWTNRTTNPNWVGNFTRQGGGNIIVSNLTWNAQTVKALGVDQTLSRAVKSALVAPAEITGNNPVSVEAWIFATNVNQQNSCAVGYGLQGGSGNPQEHREFNYSVPGSGGGVSGNFGSFDTSWHTTPAPGAWHYLAWTYDGGTVKLYLDGNLDTQNNPNSPLITPATVVGVGAAPSSSSSNLGADSFQGYVACARVMSGVLTPADIATNYLAGLLGSAAAITPSGLSATPDDGLVVLGWNRSPNASSYNLKRSASLNGTYNNIATGLTGLSYTNTGLSDGTTYYYEVSAVNSAGESTNSPAVSATPLAPVPPSFTYNYTGGQIQITWPQNFIGWNLQVETNAPGAGLGTNWVTVPGSTATNMMTLPVDTTQGSVFYRLVSP